MRNSIDSAQDGDFWKALLNAAFTFRVLKAVGLLTKYILKAGVYVRSYIYSFQERNYWRNIVNSSFNS